MSVGKIAFSLMECLLVTVIIEGIFTVAITRKWKFVRYNIYCNLLTNPFLNIVALLLLSTLGKAAYSTWVVAGEIMVLFFEGYLYTLMSDIKYTKGLILSAATNIPSLFIGSYLLEMIN